MQITIPHYYHRFHCLAGECLDTCCAGWAIMIDDASMKRYQMRKDALGSRLYNSIDWKKRSFKQYGSRCSFLNEENLCDIYTEAGSRMLCKTCREYPRHTEEYKGVREISLSLSCEEAARLILGCKEPVRFFTKENEREESDRGFDSFLFTNLVESRKLIFSMLQNRSLDCRLRIAAVLGFAHDMQRRINQKRLYQINDLLKRYKGEDAPEIIEKKLSARRIDDRMRCEKMEEMFAVFEKLEVSQMDWPGYIGDFKEILFRDGEESYEENRKAFDRYLEENEDKRCQWEQWCEQLMVYFLR